MHDSSDSYEMEEVEVGAVERETVKAVRMSRQTFLSEVADTFERGYYDSGPGEWVAYSEEVRDKLVPIAETMPVFPLGSWVAPGRGCGCVVGEYLIAADLIDREDAATSAGRMRHADVEALLAEQEDGKALIEFGTRIDEALHKRIGVHWYDDVESKPVVILIEDD